MQLDDYTPDAISRAFGYSQFAIEPTLATPALRLLLRPSFNPEVCITLAGDTADVRIFQSQFWHMPTAAHRPVTFRQEVVVGRRLVASLAAKLFALEPQIRLEESARVLMTDGMPTTLAGRSAVTSVVVEAHVSETADAFIAEVLAKLHRHLPSGHVRIAVAAAGRYVDLALAADPLPPSNATTTLLILGDEEGRRGVGERLKRRDDTGAAPDGQVEADG